MRWVGHVSFIGDMRNEYRILVRKPVGKGPLDGRIILEWILGK